MARISVNFKSMKEAVSGLQSSRVAERRVRTTWTFTAQLWDTLNLFLHDRCQKCALDLERLLTRDADETLLNAVTSGQRGLSWGMIFEAAMEHVERVSGPGSHHSRVLERHVLSDPFLLSRAMKEYAVLEKNVLHAAEKMPSQKRAPQANNKTVNSLRLIKTVIRVANRGEVRYAHG